METVIIFSMTVFLFFGNFPFIKLFSIFFWIQSFYGSIRYFSKYSDDVTIIVTRIPNIDARKKLVCYQKLIVQLSASVAQNLSLLLESYTLVHAKKNGPIPLLRSIFCNAQIICTLSFNKRCAKIVTNHLRAAIIRLSSCCRTWAAFVFIEIIFCKPCNELFCPCATNIFPFGRSFSHCSLTFCFRRMPSEIE